MQLKWVFLLGVSLASRAACDKMIFVDPPPWDPEDDGIRDFSNNRRYRDGDDVKIRLYSKDTYALVPDLHVWQVNPVDGRKGEHKLVEPQTYEELVFWKAEYDMGRYLKHGEDAVYRFGLLQYGQTEATVNSTYFNVTVPESWKPYLPSASKTTTLARPSSTSKPTKQPRPDSTATKKPSRQGKKSSTRSGLTGPQVAGIAIGAVVAFILMVAGFCWGFERMRVARQLQRSHEFELRNMERDVRALRETVSKLGS